MFQTKLDTAEGECKATVPGVGQRPGSPPLADPRHQRHHCCTIGFSES